MSNWSLKWFMESVADLITGGKVKKQEQELEELKQIVEDLKKEPTYLKVSLTNKTLTVITVNGDILTKHDATEKDFARVKAFRTAEEVENFMIDSSNIPKKVYDEVKAKDEEVKENIRILNGFEILTESGDFETEGGSLYMKGIKRSIPKLLAKKFTELYTDRQNKNVDVFIKEQDLPELDRIDKEILSLKRFWMWCCLNPYTKVTEWLYDFLTRGDFKITQDGMFLAYRRVVTLDTKADKELLNFISNVYIKIKTIYKKSPAKHWVIETVEDNNKIYKFITEKQREKGGDWKEIGNLKDLYDNMDQMEENRFTDGHTHTFDIRIGRPVSMPRNDCNHSTANCNTGGLHFCSKLYDYSGYGDQPILVMINPYNVVGIGSDKGRTCEYLPVMTLAPEEYGTLLSESDFDTSQLEEYYAEEQLKDLESRVALDYISEQEKYKNSFAVPENYKSEVVHITEALTADILGKIKGRLQTIN